MLIEHLSPSRYEIYDTCHQKYKYRYHLKLANEGPEPFYFAYGKIVHKIAELYVRNKGKVLITEIASNVINRKIEIESNKFAPPLPIEYKNRLPGNLRVIKKVSEKMGFDGEIEYKFKYDLDPPNGKLLEGVIDRFIIKDNKCWILDYKTTKVGPFRKNSVTITSDVQLKAYARVIQKQFNIKAENIKAALCYLEGGEIVGISYTEESLNKLEKELLETYNKIENQNPDTVIGTPGFHCKNCDYNNICPFYLK